MLDWIDRARWCGHSVCFNVSNVLASVGYVESGLGIAVGVFCLSWYPSLLRSVVPCDGRTFYRHHITLLAFTSNTLPVYLHCLIPP